MLGQNMIIIVYSKPLCVQCRYTKQLLDKLQLIFTDRDVTTDQTAAHEAHHLAAELGLQLPFVVVSHTHGQPTQRWAGFCDDKIRGLLL
jgi:glutaredoxin-like protein NrdH